MTTRQWSKNSYTMLMQFFPGEKGKKKNGPSFTKFNFTSKNINITYFLKVSSQYTKILNDSIK